MITLRHRKGKEGQVTLSVRIADANRDNAVALGISTSIARCMAIEETIKQARAASAKGATFLIEDSLASELWQLIKELDAFQRSGTLTDRQIAASIKKYVHKEDADIIKEAVARKQEPAPATKPTFTEFVDQYIKDCESGVRLKQRSNKKLSLGTIRGYKVYLMHLKTYQKEKKCVIDWDDLTLEFYNNFRQYFIKKKYNPNYFSAQMKRTKTILAAAKLLHLTTRDDFMSRQWSVSYEEADNIYINNVRLKEMAALDIMDEKDAISRLKQYAKPEEYDEIEKELHRESYRKKLSEARDIFVLGCLVGQRVSDYKRINRNMIVNIVGDRKFIHLVQAKTGKEVYVPYDELMDEILNRYDGKLPKIIDQHLNKRIKVVGLLLGWTENAGLTERHGLMSYTSSKRFCDAIMTHTARRSFATNSYKAGVPLSAIMAVTGHSTEEMLKRYLKLDSKERALLAAAEFDKVAKASGISR